MLKIPNALRISVVDVLLKSAGDAPIMSKRKWAVDRTKKVAWVIEFIRKYLKFEQHDTLVNLSNYKGRLLHDRAHA
jgi:Ubiquitin-like autophagy protein Apg12